MTGSANTKFNFFNALKLSTIQFFKETTLHGYKYLVDTKRDNFLERLAWFIVVVVSLVFAIYITFLGWSDFNENPTFTTLYSQKYPIWEINFPAVTICSINRISRTAAMKYAEKLVSNERKINISWALNTIQNFGRLLDYSRGNGDLDFFEFQELLDRADPDEVIGTHNIEKTMLMYHTKVKKGGIAILRLILIRPQLAPKCSELLLRCRWEEKDIDCNNFIPTRRTAEGHCCSFNYVRTKDTLSIDSLRDPIRAYQTGMDKGLVVVLNTSSADYFYSLRSTVGFVIGIHYPYNYPDATNGNYHQFIIPSNTEAFVKLDVATIKTDQDVTRYSVEKRGCLFNYESLAEFGGHYSYADCWLRCKIQTYLSLCDCIPYMYPINFPDFGDDIKNAPRCNLNHLACLIRYKVTLMTPRPRKPIQGLEKELSDSISCPDCYPLCSLSRYQVQATYSPLSTDEIVGDSWGIMKGLLHGTSMEDVSIVRVYYPLVSTMLYKSGVVYTWHEIISYFGGLLSLCIGFSTISVMEIVYFATVRFYQNYFGKPKTTSSNTKQTFFKNPTYKNMEIILVKEYAHHGK